MEANKVDFKQLILSSMAVIGIEIALDALMSQNTLTPMTILGIKRILQTTMVVIMASASGKGPSAIGLGRSAVFSGIKKGVIWSAAFGALVAILFILLLVLKIDPLPLIQGSLPVNKTDLIIFFIVGGLLGPIAEETFFRGVLYGFLRRRGPLLAVFLSSALFAITHLAVSGVFLIQFIGGLIFAVSYEMEKNLYTPITIHALGNCAIFTVCLMN